jgi:hypothetical protein
MFKYQQISNHQLPTGNQTRPIHRPQQGFCDRNVGTDHFDAITNIETQLRILLA